MQSRGREYRIRQRQRKRAEQAKRAKENQWNQSPKAIGIMTNTPTPCSKHCCGNPRKFHGNGKDGQTLAERSCKHAHDSPIDLDNIDTE